MAWKAHGAISAPTRTAVTENTFTKMIETFMNFGPIFPFGTNILYACIFLFLNATREIRFLIIVAQKMRSGFFNNSQLTFEQNYFSQNSTRLSEYPSRSTYRCVLWLQLFLTKQANFTDQSWQLILKILKIDMAGLTTNLDSSDSHMDRWK